MKHRIKNWSKTIVDQPLSIKKPNSIDELIDIIKLTRNKKDRLKIYGSLHSFNKISASDNGIALTLDNIKGKFTIDDCKITIPANFTLNKINQIAKKANLAISSLGTIDKQTIAGAIATGTHGSGIQFGALSNFITALKYIDGEGNYHEINHTENEFKAFGLHLGALGIITEVTLQCEPSFNLNLTTTLSKFNELSPYLSQLERFRHFKILYFPGSDDYLVWHANKASSQTPLNYKKAYFKEIISHNLYYELLNYLSLSFGLKQAYVVKKIQRSMFCNASNITGTSLDIFLENFIQKLTNMEYAIPIENTLACLEELQFYFKNKANILHGPLEIRPSKGDPYYLSPTANKEVAYFGFVVYHPYGKIIDYPSHFSEIEQILLKYGGRPHWGKYFSLNQQQISELFPELSKFIEIKNQVDPGGIFNNSFLDHLFF